MKTRDGTRKGIAERAGNMITLLTLPEIRPQKTGRILAIESDPARARSLDHILRDKVRAEIEIVKSLNEAISAIDRAVPDLVLLHVSAAGGRGHAVRPCGAAADRGPRPGDTLPHFVDADGSTATVRERC